MAKLAAVHLNTVIGTVEEKRLQNERDLGRGFRKGRINEVAKAGKAELNIPMYTNAWLGLTKLLLEHSTAATPATHALIALMNFNAARLPAEPMRGVT